MCSERTGRPGSICCSSGSTFADGASAARSSASERCARRLYEGQWKYTTCLDMVVTGQLQELDAAPAGIAGALDS